MTHEQFEKAASVWMEFDAKNPKAPEDLIRKKAEEFLNSHNTCALATACEGMVRCTPIEYLWHDGRIWLYSEGGLKFKALEQNKDVALAIFDPFSGFGSTHGMQISGVAEIVDEDSSLYDKMLSVRHLSREKLKRTGGHLHLIKITPTRIDLLLSEFKKEGYSPRQCLVPQIQSRDTPDC